MASVERIVLAPNRVPLRVAIASTPSERQRGLQHQESLDGVDGMLFEYTYPSSAPFWMQHTFLDLTIAWFDKTGRCLGWQDMDAHTTVPVTPPAPFSYVLEVPRGSVDFFPDIQLRVNRSRRHHEATVRTLREDDGPGAVPSSIHDLDTDSG